MNKTVFWGCVCAVSGLISIYGQTQTTKKCSAYSSYFLVMEKSQALCGLCKHNGEMTLPVRFEHLECLGKNTGLWWALEKSEGGLAGIYQDNGSLFSTKHFPSSVDWLTGWCGVKTLDTGEILVPNGKCGPYFFGHIIYPDGFIQRLDKGLMPSRDGKYTTIVAVNGRVSLYDVHARRAIPGMEYDDIMLSLGSACIVTDSGKEGLVNMSGKILIPLSGHDVFFHDYGKSDLVIVKDKDSMGVYDPDKQKWLIEPKEGYVVNELSHNVATVSKRDEQKMISLLSGSPLPAVGKQFTLLVNSERGGVDFWGASDGKSRAITSIFGISSNRVFTINNIDKISKNYSDDGRSLLFFTVKNTKDKSEGALSKDGQRILFPLTKNISIFDWGRNILVKDLRTKTILVQALGGKVLVDWGANATDLAWHLDSSGYARIVCDGKAGLVDGDCNFVLPCQYEDVGHFGEGLVPAKQGGKWGFVEISGKWALPARFEEARSFKDGYAPVRVGGKWGFIDKSGKAATPFAYEDVKDVREGHFRAKVDGKWGIFALDGTCTLPAEYDAILAEGEPGYGEM